MFVRCRQTKSLPRSHLNLRTRCRFSPLVFGQMLRCPQVQTSTDLRGFLCLDREWFWLDRFCSLNLIRLDLGGCFDSDPVAGVIFDFSCRPLRLFQLSDFLLRSSRSLLDWRGSSQPVTTRAPKGHSFPCLRTWPVPKFSKAPIHAQQTLDTQARGWEEDYGQCLGNLPDPILRDHHPCRGLQSRLDILAPIQ